MDEASSSGPVPGIARGKAVGTRAADWLSLAAAPVFAIMAALTGTVDGTTMAALCGATHA